jgi:hypothetical protein
MGCLLGGVYIGLVPITLATSTPCSSIVIGTKGVRGWWIELGSSKKKDSINQGLLMWYVQITQTNPLFVLQVNLPFSRPRHHQIPSFFDPTTL